MCIFEKPTRYVWVTAMLCGVYGLGYRNVLYFIFICCRRSLTQHYNADLEVRVPLK